MRRAGINKSKETMQAGGRVGGLSTFHGWSGETSVGGLGAGASGFWVRMLQAGVKGWRHYQPGGHCGNSASPQGLSGKE